MSVVIDQHRLQTIETVTFNLYRGHPQRHPGRTVSSA